MTVIRLLGITVAIDNSTTLEDDRDDVTPFGLADIVPPDRGEAERLARFLRALHCPAPHDAPGNQARGVPLEARRAAVEPRLDRLRHETDRITPTIDRLWRDALDAPVHDEAVWIHGDLHPRNVLVEDRRFSAVIDWGDMTSGDAACDLAAAWMLFEAPSARRTMLRRYAPDRDLERRAIGSAVGFGAVLLDTGRVDDPRHAAIGEATLARLERDFG